MSPFKGGFESWSYTVKTAAMNAVMAGARPEYLQVILAIVSTGMEAISVPDNSLVVGTVIIGDIRGEIDDSTHIASIPDTGKRFSLPLLKMFMSVDHLQTYPSLTSQSEIPVCQSF